MIHHVLSDFLTVVSRAEVVVVVSHPDNRNAVLDAGFYLDLYNKTTLFCLSGLNKKLGGFVWFCGFFKSRGFLI